MQLACIQVIFGWITYTIWPEMINSQISVLWTKVKYVVVTGVVKVLHYSSSGAPEWPVTRLNTSTNRKARRIRCAETQPGGNVTSFQQVARSSTSFSSFLQIKKQSSEQTTLYQDRALHALPTTEIEPRTHSLTTFPRWHLPRLDELVWLSVVGKKAQGGKSQIKTSTVLDHHVRSRESFIQPESKSWLAAKLIWLSCAPPQQRACNTSVHNH